MILSHCAAPVDGTVIFVARRGGLPNLDGHVVPLDGTLSESGRYCLVWVIPVSDF